VAKKYLHKLQEETGIEADENSEEFANLLNKRMKEKTGGANQRLAILFGMLTKDKENPITTKDANENKSTFAREKYKFLLFSPFDVSARCCNIMKKYPAHEYARKTGRLPMTAQMADESRLRRQKWLLNGCNAFDLEYPISNPMSFWTEDDVLEYIYTTGIEICSVYGDIVEDYGETMDGQISLTDYGFCCGKCKYKTTGCKRTGCVLCAYGAGGESKEESRFRKLKKSHPKFYALLDLIQNKGITYRQAIEWVNEHIEGRGHIWL
jgi:3'-phosphoadenosine 5'-phosphosulfate sulfotransferase (PAPS reductase)/FAD synthetase